MLAHDTHETIKLMLTLIWMGLALLVIGITITIVLLRHLRHGQAELHKTLKNHLIYHVSESVDQDEGL